MRTYGSMGALRGVANSAAQAKMMCQIDVRLRQSAVGVSHSAPGVPGCVIALVVIGVSTVVMYHSACDGHGGCRDAVEV